MKQFTIIIVFQISLLWNEHNTVVLQKYYQQACFY